MPRSDLCAHCDGLGDKRREQFHNQGVELVAWYKRRPEGLTHRYDHQIAAELGWFPPGQLEGRGNADRVVNLRKGIDRCKCLFEDYSFGTKRAMPGRHTSRLRERGNLGSMDAVALHLSEQLGRIVQADNFLQSEFAQRAIPFLTNTKEDMVALGNLDVAFACDRAIRDLEQFNSITPSTRAEMQRLGIPIPGFA